MIPLFLAALLTAGCADGEGGGGRDVITGDTSRTDGDVGGEDTASPDTSSPDTSADDTSTSDAADSRDDTGDVGDAGDVPSDTGTDAQDTSPGDMPDTVDGTDMGDTSSDATDTADMGPGCGDGSVDSGEDCEPGVAITETCADVGTQVGPLGCNSDCSYDTSACFDGGQLPGAGDMVITEVMVQPVTTPESDGEWFEVFNQSGTPLDLGGCWLSDDGADRHVIASSVEIPSMGRALLAVDGASPAGGAPTDYLYPAADLGFDNASDTLRIECPSSTGSEIVDEISWDDGATFPDTAAFAMQLDPDRRTSTDNDDGLLWCNAVIDGGAGSYDGGTHYGTPGAPNSQCQIGWCILQFPKTICSSGCDADPADLPITVYGQVFADGQTNLTDGADPSPRLVGELGYGPSDESPIANANFTWIDASVNTGFMGAGRENNDEYEADLPSTLTSGTYRMYYRFSLDGGDSWQYCDQNGATPQGGTPSETFDAADAGTIDVP